MSETITASVALVAVLLTLSQTWLTKRHRIKDLELVYVSRYWTIRDRLDGWTMGHETSLSRLTGNPGTSRPRSLAPTAVDDMRRYLELCEDEIDLRAQGWITDATWAFWRSAIVSAVASEPFGTLWREVRNEPSGFARLRSLEEHVQRGTTETYDPCTLPWRTRWYRGLTGRG